MSINMLEIYSERVRDLLNGGAELHVREGGERGFHAVNQKTIVVQVRMRMITDKGYRVFFKKVLHKREEKMQEKKKMT